MHEDLLPSFLAHPYNPDQLSDGIGSEAAAEMCLKLATLDYNNCQVIWQATLLHVQRLIGQFTTSPTLPSTKRPF